MSTKSELSHIINSVWADSPVGFICNSIVDYITSERSDEIRHITTNTLQKITGNRYSDDTLLEAALYLSGKNPHLLEIQYLLIDDSDNEEPISLNELKDAKKYGKLVHPVTGEEVSDYEDYLFFYFFPSNDAQNITE